MTAGHRFTLHHMTEKSPLSPLQGGDGVSRGKPIKQKWIVAGNAELIKYLLQQLFFKQSTPYIPGGFTSGSPVVSDVAERLEQLPPHVDSWETAHRILRREASLHRISFSAHNASSAVACLHASTVHGVSQQGKNLLADMGPYPQTEGAAYSMLAAVAKYDCQVHRHSVVQAKLNMEFSQTSDAGTPRQRAQQTQEIQRLMRELQGRKQISS